MHKKYYNFTVSTDIDSLRLDKALVLLFHNIDIKDFSRSNLQKFITSGAVTLNYQIANKPDIKVKYGDILTIDLSNSNIEESKSNLEAKYIPLNIIYEDEYFLVIDKQAGLTVHPGSGNQDNTLVNALLYHNKELSNISEEKRPGIVHRLDKDTSGLMVVAKNNLAHISLAKQIANREFTRKYKALIWGVMSPEKGVIDANIGRSRSDGKKMTIYKIGGRKAITHYDILQKFCNGLFSLIECKLETGRTHQIRVHLSQNAHSIIGDQIYGNHLKKSKNIINQELQNLMLQCSRQMLHAYYIKFSHPYTNKNISFESDMPQDIANIISRLEEI